MTLLFDRLKAPHDSAAYHVRVLNYGPSIGYQAHFVAYHPCVMSRAMGFTAPLAWSAPEAWCNAFNSMIKLCPHQVQP